MQLTQSFLALLRHFDSVFTAPTFQTFLQIASGWLISQRQLFITEMIFSSGNVGIGHWSRFHRFFSHAAWDVDVLAFYLAKMVVHMLAPGSTLYWAVDDKPSCRKRGLTLSRRRRHAPRSPDLQSQETPGQLGA